MHEFHLAHSLATKIRTMIEGQGGGRLRRVDLAMDQESRISVEHMREHLELALIEQGLGGATIRTEVIEGLRAVSDAGVTLIGFELEQSELGPRDV